MHLFKNLMKMCVQSMCTLRVFPKTYFYLWVHVCLHACAYMQLLTLVKEGIRPGELK